MVDIRHCAIYKKIRKGLKGQKRYNVINLYLCKNNIPKTDAVTQSFRKYLCFIAVYQSYHVDYEYV